MENLPTLLLNIEEEQKPLTKEDFDKIFNNNDNNISLHKDKTFNKLRKLQKLIKKESTLKKLCK